MLLFIIERRQFPPCGRFKKSAKKVKTRWCCLHNEFFHCLTQFTDGDSFDLNCSPRHLHSNETGEPFWSIFLKRQTCLLWTSRLSLRKPSFNTSCERTVASTFLRTDSPSGQGCWKSQDSWGCALLFVSVRHPPSWSDCQSPTILIKTASWSPPMYAVTRCA